MRDGSFGLRACAQRAVAIAVTAALAAIAAPSAATAADYVGMGDSYSSGTGTREYFNAGCERSVHAYPYLIQGSFGSFTFIACGGAKTQDVLNNQVSSLSAGTKYATISIGGNDAGFSSVITECAQPALFSNCNGAVNTAQSYIQNTLPGRLNLVYDEIRERAPNAVVAAVGYPRLFNGEDCNAGTFFSGDEMTRLNQTADMLASVTRGRALAHGFTFVDARAAFLGHAVCDDVEWLNGLSNPTSESYHPNRTGHSSGYAGIVRAALQAAPKPDAPVGGVGRIAFSSSRSGNNDVWVINANGQFPVNLTQDPSSDIDPAWSPDGTKVAFASDRDGDNEIYVMNGDGTGVAKLTNNTFDDRDPAWSPNGVYIAFRSNRTGNNEVFRMTQSGGSQTNLTNHSASDFAPDWSPDGSEIAFQRFTSGSGTGLGNEVLKANADGQGQTNLTNNASSANDGQPGWSPNGNTIAFHSNRDGDFEIFTMPGLGGTATQRTTNTATDQGPTYSPTGSQIAFNSNRDGNDEIYTMTSTGGSQTNRTASAGSDTSASWQADSTPPLTTISAGPSGPVNADRPTFQFASSELGSTHQCRIDNGSFASCTSPFQPASLPEGEHTFTVRATDPAGNVDPTPPVRTFVVDTTPPELALECPQTVVLNSDASATVLATDATSGMASIDDPSGAHALDTSEPGTHTFSIHAIDLAGNIASKECEYEVRYPDPGKPALTEGESPNAGAFTLGWTASAPASYPLRYVLERRAAGGDEWSQVASGLGDPAHAFTRGDVADEGTWVFRVKGVDEEHAVETGWSQESTEVKVDQTAARAPSITADRDPEYPGGGGWFRDSAVVSTSDNGDPDLRDGSAPSGVDPASVVGAETVTASATVRRTVRDRVGNESSETTLAVQVDTHDPSLQLDCPATVLLGGEASVTVTAADGQSGLAHDPSGTFALDTTQVGPQVIERTATDNVGHERTERCEVVVAYAYDGLLQPVNRDGSSIFRLGSSIPLKFRLADVNGRPVTDAEAVVQMERISAAVQGTVIEEVVLGTATNGKVFTYDAAENQYIYTLATKPLSRGTWVVRISLDDGTVHLTTISLR
jgi:Tol biopolymer transport system component